MPVNFLHPVFAYLVNRWKPSFSLPALLVGSIIPDVEVIPIYYLTNGEIDRLFFHSIIGAVTLGTFLSLFVVIFVYPSFVSAIFRIDLKEIKKECRFSKTLVGVCMLGNLLHVLIDATSHEYNPLLYPISSYSIDVFRISNDLIFDNIVINIILTIVLLVIVIASIKRGTKGFWKKMLVSQNIPQKN